MTVDGFVGVYGVELWIENLLGWCGLGLMLLATRLGGVETAWRGITV